MPKIPATEKQTFEVDVPIAEVYDAFVNTEVVKQNFVGLEDCELREDGEARWIVKEKADKGIRFKGDYTVKYEGNGKDHVTWRTTAGNVDTNAEVRLTETSSGVRVEYEETVAPDLPIPRLMAKVFKPIVAKEVRKDLKAYIDNVRRYLSTRSG